MPGDEVITVAAGFPTTVNPIIQNGLVPVFVDVHVPTYNIDVTQLEEALFGPHPGGDDRAHAGESVRPGRGERFRRPPQPVADRGLLRRRGVDLSTAARSGLSAISPRSASIRRITSPWARAAACSPRSRC